MAWFTTEMPPTYFRQVKPSTQERHLRAITALASERIATPEVRLVESNAADDSYEVTFLFEGSAAGDGGMRTLTRQLSEDIKPGSELRRVHLFSSLDQRLSLSIFDVSAVEEPRFALGDSASPADRRAREDLREYVSQSARAARPTSAADGRARVPDARARVSSRRTALGSARGQVRRQGGPRAARARRAERAQPRGLPLTLLGALRALVAPAAPRAPVRALR